MNQQRYTQQSGILEELKQNHKSLKHEINYIDKLSIDKKELLIKLNKQIKEQFLLVSDLYDALLKEREGYKNL